MTGRLLNTLAPANADQAHKPLVGAFIIGLLSNGSDLLGINPYWQQVTIVAVIILAVALDVRRKRSVASA